MWHHRSSWPSPCMFNFKSSDLFSFPTLELKLFLARLKSRMITKLMIQKVIPMIKPSRAEGMNM